MRKNFVFWIHSIAGLLSGLFIFLLSLSGTALVFHEDIDQFQQTHISQSGAYILPVDSSYDHLQKQYPHAQISSCSLPENAAEAFIFSIYDPSYKNGTAALQVFLHPQTAGVLQTRGSKDIQNNFMGWLSVFHNSFQLGKTGEWMLGVFSLVFLISIITGIMLYRKNIGAVLTFKKAAFKKGNFHQIIGTWALLFNLMIAVTGFWMQRYVFKKEFYSSTNYTSILRPSPPLFFHFDSAYAGVKKQYPDFTARVIYFAQSGKGRTAVYGNNSTNSFIHSKEFADAIFLDSTGKIVKKAFVNEIPAADRYDIINSQVHFGKYGGWPVKILYGFLGLAGGLLSITGFLLWYKRKKALLT